MKLHLPKRLFTALLTAITLAAAPAALTLGSAAWGVEDADSTAWSGSSDTWYVTSDAENALESIDATTTNKTSVFIRATKDDVVRTVEALTLKSGDTLTIAGDWGSATAHFDALTIDSLIIGSGEQPGSANLTVGAAQTSGSVTPAQAVTINSITGSVGNLNLGAASTLTLNGPVTFVAGSVLTLNDGSDLILNNAGEIEFNSHNAGVGITTTGDSGTVTIGSGTTAKLTNTGQKGVAAIDGIIKVLGGGKLLLAGNKSLLGHSNLDDATNAVYLKGDSAGNMATMEFATNYAQHLNTNLYLEGYAQITDSTAAGTFAFIECYGGGITATGTQNTIATSLFVNKNTTINVIGTNDELTITGRILSDNTGDVLTKSGEGTLTIAGEGLHGVFYSSGNGTITESDIKFTFVNSAGTTNINADTAFHKLEVSGGKVNINSDVTVKNTLTLSSKNLLAISAGGSLTLNPGTITFSDESMVTGAGTLHIMDGTTLIMSHSGGTASVKGSTIHVHGGGILNLNGNDRLGWESNATGAILLKGESDTKVATLQLGGRQTMTTSLLMQGNALVVSTGGTGGSAGGLNPLNASGAQITATGKNNIINATLHRRDAFLIEVTYADDELEVQGNVVTQDGGTSGGYDGLPYVAGSIVKDGAGKLTFSGSGNTFDRKYLHKAGTSVMSGTANFTSTVEIQSGKFETSGTTTMSGAITNSGTFEVSGGTATISGAVTNNSAIAVSGGSATLSGTVANSGDITVSGGTANFTNTLDMGAGSSLSVTDGSATLGGTVTNNGTITVSGGTASFTNTLGMGTGSSLSVSGGSATLSGALNVTGTGVEIAQSGEGVLNLLGQVSVAEGAALTMGGTITLNHTITNDGTLTLNGAIYLTGDITKGFVEETAGGVTYSGTLEDQEETYNGFKTISGATYKLTQSSDGVSGTVKNTLGGNFATDSAGKTVVYHGDEEYEVTSKDGQLYFSTGTITGTEYYITTDEVVVDDAVRAVATGYTLQGGIMKLQGGSVATSNITYTSGSVALSDAATLIIDVADNSNPPTATHWLTNTTGTAGTTIEIAANANFGEVSGSPREYKTSFEGKWVVSNGATLKLGGLDGGYNNAYKVDLLSLESLDLDGGNLRFFGDSGKLGQVNVKQNARFDIHEMYDDDSLLNIAGLNLYQGATLTMDTVWRSHVNIDALSGAGTLKLESGSTYSTFKANVTDEYTGVFDLNHVADMMYVELNVAENATATIEGDSDTSINKLTLKNGASFDIDTNGANNHGFTYSLGSVGIEDSATIQTTQDHGGWQAEVNIGSLTGNADAVLNIISNTKTTQRSIINLNGGNFDGTVNVTGSSSGGDRKIALNVNDSTVLADAVVRMHGNSSQVALAIGGAEGNSVTLKGINDQENANGTIVIVSGAQDYDTNADFLSANEYDSHTLVIDTDGSGESDPNATGGTYSTKATITAGLNLQKEGNGKQTFSGDFSRFDGSVTVNGGTLEITTADTSSKSWGITTATVNQGASLRLGGTVTVGSMSAAGSIALDADSTLSLGGGTHSIGTLSAASAGVTLGESATLTLGGGTDAKNQVTHSIGTLTGGSGSYVNLAEHAVLDTISSANGVTLTGRGTYKLAIGTSTMTSGMTLGADWTGTVVVENSTGQKDITKALNDLGNSKSTVQVTNLEGYFETARANVVGVVNPNLHLVNGTDGKSAIKIINGNCNGINAVIAGDISGSGDITHQAWSGAQGRYANYEFTGNVTQWTGNFIVGDSSSSGHANVIFSGDATKINAGFRMDDDANKLHLQIGKSDETDKQYEVNGVVSADALTAYQSADFTKEVTVANAVTVSADKTAGFYSTLTANTVTNNGTLKLGKIVTSGEGEEEKQVVASISGGTMSKVQMSSTGSSTGISGTAQDGSSSMSNADIEVLAQDATFTIADMTLTNTSITAATVNTQVNFDNVTVSGAVVLKNLNVAMSDAQVGAGGSAGSMGTFTGSTTLLSGITMSAGSSLTVDLGDLSSYAAMGPGKYDLSITLSGFSMDSYTGAYAGSGLQFAADSWLGELLAQGNNANVQISISQAEAGAAAAAAGVSSGSTGVSYSTGNVGMVITITGLNVPEPTTSTLSLLALAALVARRRRK